LARFASQPKTGRKRRGGAEPDEQATLSGFRAKVSHCKLGVKGSQKIKRVLDLKAFTDFFSRQTRKKQKNKRRGIERVPR